MLSTVRSIHFATIGSSIACVLIAGTALAFAQQTSHIDSEISGYWQMRPDSLNAPPADLTPSAMAKREEIYKENQYARRWCNSVGTPGIMTSYRPVDIAVGEYQVVVPSEFVPLPRHIYFRSSHNDPDIYEPNSIGDSIAKWDGDDLLVETTGFSEGGLNEIPGGGFRTKNSMLAERYHPMNGGKNLLVTSTWYDPTVFTHPYTYSVYYYRAVLQGNEKVPYNAGEMTCDPTEPNRDWMMAPPTPVAMILTKPESAPASSTKKKRQ